MPTKRLYIITLAFFVIGGLIGFSYAKHYYSAQLKENKQITLDIIYNSTAALKASDKLVNMCYSAYYVVTDCANDFASCSMEKTNNDLEVLKKKEERVNLELKDLVENMDNIILKVKATYGND